METNAVGAENNGTHSRRNSVGGSSRPSSVVLSLKRAQSAAAFLFDGAHCSDAARGTTPSPPPLLSNAPPSPATLVRPLNKSSSPVELSRGKSNHPSPSPLQETRRIDGPAVCAAFQCLRDCLCWIPRGLLSYVSNYVTSQR